MGKESEALAKSEKKNHKRTLWDLASIFIIKNQNAKSKCDDSEERTIAIPFCILIILFSLIMN